MTLKRCSLTGQVLDFFFKSHQFKSYKPINFRIIKLIEMYVNWRNTHVNNIYIKKIIIKGVTYKEGRERGELLSYEWPNHWRQEHQPK